jgi:hypothetical protein
MASVTALALLAFGISRRGRLRAFQMNRQVLFCSAACKGDNGSFTIAPHPDVGEGAKPATGSTGSGLFYFQAWAIDFWAFVRLVLRLQRAVEAA